MNYYSDENDESFRTFIRRGLLFSLPLMVIAGLFALFLAFAPENWISIAGDILAFAVLTFLLMFMMVLLGTLVRIFFRDMPAQKDPAENDQN